ncbi:iron-containing alcohol dehydrogenase [Flavobacteriaceae bacterium]|nr:iron-containing alcohol dehydrogenase [Flavobacteriaceae bacterium]
MNSFFYKIYAKIAGPIFKMVPYSPPEQLENQESLVKLFLQQGVKNPVLITDRIIRSLGLVDDLVKLFAKENIDLVVFDDVEADPSFKTVVKGAEFCKNHDFDGIIAVGGGSVLDAAKIINVTASSGRNPKAFKGMFRVLKKGKLFAAIPTTAGTGSEMTVVSVITDREKQIKETIIDPAILPSYTLHDPELLTGLPKRITAETGIDALSHAFEAYMSRYCTPQTDALAEEAIALVFKNLKNAVNDGSDLSYRSAMLDASSKAGMAFTRTSVGWVHALAHQFGGIYHLPHGRMIGLVILDIAKFYRDSQTERLANLAKVIGVATIFEDKNKAADEFINALARLLRDVEIPEKLEELKKEDIPEIAKRALLETYQKPYGVPKYFKTPKDLESFIKRYLVESE